MIWLRLDHADTRLLPAAFAADLKARLLIATPANETDLLWATEEALRAGIKLVIAEPEKPLSLTAGRRLQLAAEAGGGTGLMLIRAGAGSPAVETRWQCDPVPGDSTRHRWNLIKNKSGTNGTWIIDTDGTSAAFDMVCATRQRSGPAQTPS